MHIVNAGPNAGQDALRGMGPRLKVQIGYHPATKPDPEAVEATEMFQWEALVDTGASTSCIDAKLAKVLRLRIIDRKPMGGVHGYEDTDIHLAYLFVPSLELPYAGPVCALPLSDNFGVAAILGRDFLSRCIMHYDGITGRVTIATPEIDEQS